MQTTYKRRMKRQVGDTHHRASLRKSPLPELATPAPADALSRARQRREALLEPKSTSTNDPTKDNAAQADEGDGDDARK